MYQPLFDPIQLGSLTLNNRVILPALTRCRTSQPGNIPNKLMAEYYTQRASAGLLISEACQVEPRGQGYAWTPGIHTQEQIEGWKLVTQSVHQADGKIFLQLWHVGRVSHTTFQPDGQAPVAPSPIKAEEVSVFIETGPGEGALAEPSEPRELEVGEIAEIVGYYEQAAKNALEAGFDGVEIHAANGYLVNQFISERSNHRNDAYGGSLENRLRFLKEVTESVIGVVGADKVGVRFAPLFETTDEDRIYLGLVEDDPFKTYTVAAKMLNDMNIAYLSIAEADWENAPALPEDFCQALRDTFKGVIMYAGKYTADKALGMLGKGYGDIFGYGRAFIANPDLPERIRLQKDLNPLREESLFGGSGGGYTDYPCI
jgi:N-ethylmaleimide reductase